MAARLLCPVDEPADAALAPSEGAVPGGFAAPEAFVPPAPPRLAPAGTEEEPNLQPPPRLHHRLAETRARALKSGLLAEPPASSGPDGESAPPPAPASTPASPFTTVRAAPSPPPPFQVPLGSLPVRARALTDWLREHFQLDALFIADDQGQPLAEWGGGGDLLAAASVLAEAARRARRHLPHEPTASVVHLPLGPARMLSLIGAETALGPWHAGLTASFPIPDAGARLIARGLKKIAEGELA